MLQEAIDNIFHVQNVTGPLLQPVLSIVHQLLPHPGPQGLRCRNAVNLTQQRRGDYGGTYVITQSPGTSAAHVSTSLKGHVGP